MFWPISLVLMNIQTCRYYTLTVPHFKDNFIIKKRCYLLQKRVQVKMPVYFFYTPSISNKNSHIVCKFTDLKRIRSCVLILPRWMFWVLLDREFLLELIFQIVSGINVDFCNKIHCLLKSVVTMNFLLLFTDDEIRQSEGFKNGKQQHLNYQRWILYYYMY